MKRLPLLRPLRGVRIAVFGVVVWVAVACGSTAVQPTPPPTSSYVLVSVQADPPAYRGPCPATIAFSARIAVTGAPGVVSYRFIRSDSALGPARTLIFREAGSMDVRDTWSLGLPGFRYSGWEAVRIVSPAPGSESPHANFTISCT